MSGADRISMLPDPLLHYILAFLKTKEVVSTRILSRRWKHLWACVPTLKFKSNEFRDKLEFENFLNFVSEHRQVMSLDTFELRWKDWTSTFAAAERLLSHAVKCQPRVIILDTSSLFYEFLDFAGYVFTCESLEELILFTNMDTWECCESTYAVKSKSVNLKRLKKIDICGNVNVDDDFMRQLMLGSPGLEELDLCCSYEGLSTISSETVKHLAVSWVNARFMNEGECIEISIPSLVSLYIREDLPSRFSCNNLESLVDACIYIDHVSYWSLAALLSGMSNATKLSLYPLLDMELFEEELPELPFCPILTNLKEMFCQISSFYPIPWLLQHAPNLEKLTLEYFFFGSEEEYDEGWDFSFSCKKLKMLEIYYFDVEEVHDALNLLSYGEDLPDDIEIKLHRKR